MELKESWYEKLCRWEEAKHAYEKRLQHLGGWVGYCGYFYSLWILSLGVISRVEVIHVVKVNACSTWVGMWIKAGLLRCT
jgi:hypothetical protein